MQILEDKEASGSTEERKRQRNNGIVTARGKKNLSKCVSSQFKGYKGQGQSNMEKKVLEGEKEQNSVSLEKQE